jgi:hypothetical protein
MKARNPLDIDTTHTVSLGDAPAGADEVDATTEPADTEASPWVEMAAGQAVRAAGPPTIAPARRSLETAPMTTEAVHQAELAREQAMAEADTEPSSGYRAVHATVFTLVMAFFAGGVGLCVYVLVR